MSGCGVKLKALNHLGVLSAMSVSVSSTPLRGALLCSGVDVTHKNKMKKLLHHPLSLYLSASAVPRSFSPFYTLPQRSCNGIAPPLPHGVAQAVSVEQQQSSSHLLQVVLVSPQIPGNAGSIARTCAASGVKLHLVEPMGFQIDDTKLKRAGLDYWPYVVVKVHPSWAEFRDYFSLQNGKKRLLAFTKRGTAIHSDFAYRPGDWLVFGSETSGLPPEVLLDCTNERYGGATIKIPMVDTYVRCLNLSVSVGIAVYEAARQLNYEQLQCSPETCINGENPFITEREDIFA